MRNPLHRFSVGLVLIGAICLSTLVLAPEAYPAEPAGKPCCEIVALDPGKGLVTVKETATGATFQFKANSAKLLKRFKVGQTLDTNAIAQGATAGRATKETKRPFCKCGKRLDGTCWCVNRLGALCHNPLCPSVPGGKESIPSMR